jgi:hypothetical protein
MKRHGRTHASLLSANLFTLMCEHSRIVFLSLRPILQNFCKKHMCQSFSLLANGTTRHFFEQGAFEKYSASALISLSDKNFDISCITGSGRLPSRNCKSVA